MVAIVSGSGVGLERSSAGILGGRGVFGQAAFGRDGGDVYVNSANGNLIIQRTDELLFGIGPDSAMTRTYNSRVASGNWQFTACLGGLTGTVNTAGSTVRRISADGTDVTYTYDTASGAYRTRRVGGGYDTLTFSSGANTWTWVEGGTLVQEVYDGSTNRIVSRKDADLNILTFGYTSGQLTSLTTSNGEVTTLVYSGANLSQLQTTYNDAGVNKTLTRVRYGYDGSNRLTTVTVDLTPDDNSVADGATYVTTYSYDGASNRIASITQTDGSSVQFVYGLVSGDMEVTSFTQTSATGVTRTSTLSYNTAINATTVTDPLGNATVYSYSATAPLTQVVAPAVGGTSQVTSFSYLSPLDVQTITAPDGGVVTYGYDSLGHRTSDADALGDTVTRTFSTTNKVLTETRWLSPPAGSPVTTRYAYDAEDHLRYVVDADGRVTQYRYDTPGNLISVIEYTANTYDVSALGTTTALSESTLDAWRSAISDKSTTKRVETTYDARGNVDTVTIYEKVLTSGSGDATSVLDVTTYRYDQAGKLKRLERTGTGGAETYQYDGLFRLKQSVDLQGATTNITFSDAANTTTVNLANGLVQTSIYDLAGELISYSESGSSVATATTTYKYDADGRLRMTTNTVTGEKSYVLYDEAGRKVADIANNGQIVEYAYNKTDQLVQVWRHRGMLSAAQLASLVNGSGDPANVTLASVRPASDGGDRYQWSIYDSAGRLIETVTMANGEGLVTTYAYDGAGRLISTKGYSERLAAATVNGFKTTPPTSLALPTAAPSADRVTRYFYDGSGRLIGTLDGVGYLTRVLYDGAGQQTHTIRYFNVTTASLRAAGTFSQLLTSVGTHAKDIHNWQLFDARGLVRAAIDGEGGLTRYAYDAMGHLSQEIRGQKLNADSLISTPPTLATLPAAGGSEVLEATTYQSTPYGQVTQETKALAGGVNELTTYSYDNMRRLVRKTTAVGTNDQRIANWRFDQRGRLTGELGGMGSAALAALGSSPTDAQVNDIYDTYGVTYVYDGADRMISKREANGVNAAGDRTLYYYDGNGRLVFTINARGEVFEQRYSSFDQVTETFAYGSRIGTGTLATLSGGVVTSGLTTAIAGIANAGLDTHEWFVYDFTGLLSDHWDGEGHRTRYSQNAFGELVAFSRQQTSGAYIENLTDYDQRGKVVDTRKDDSGLNATQTYEYDAFGRVTKVTDPIGRFRTYSYDRAGRTVSSTDAAGQITTYAYDARGNVLTFTDRVGRLTTYTYDAFSRHVTVTTPETIVTSTTLNAYGQTVSVTDGLGRTTAYEYSDNGELEQVTDALGQQTSRNFDTAGRVHESIDARGISTTYTYDAADRLLSSTVHLDGASAVTTYDYDAKGQQVQVTGPTGIVTRIDYDLDGRKVKVTEDYGGLNLATYYAYDANDNVLSVVEPAGTTTRYFYDGLDRVYQTKVDYGAAGLVTNYTYDLAGNVVSRTDAAGGVTRYVYDAENRLTYTVSPVGDVKHTIYDAEGRVLTVREYATRIPAATLAALPLAATESQVLAGLPSTDSDFDHLAHTVYDGDGRVRFTLQSILDDTRVQLTEYVYDALGNVVRKIVYAGTIPVQTTYTLAAVQGQITSLGLGSSASNRITRYVYDQLGREAFCIDAVGAVTAYGYDAVGDKVKEQRLDTLYTAANGGITGDPTLAAMTTWVSGHQVSASDRTTRTYYDKAGRAVFAVDALGFVTETKYDLAGLVTRQIRYAAAYSVNDATTEASLRTLIGTPSGALTTRFVYDAAGELRFSIDAAGSVTGYKYDAEGRVSKKTRFTTVYGAGDPASPTLADMLSWANSHTAGQTSRAYYDAAGRLVYSAEGINASGQGYITETQYDGVGRVTKQIRYATTYYTDDAVTLASLKAALPATVPATAAVSRFIYDAVGHRMMDIDAEGGVTAYQYDSFDAAVKQTRMYVKWTGSTDPTYGDMLTWVNGHLDTNDRTTRTLYDTVGQAAYSVDGAGYVTERRYDVDGHVTSQIRYATAYTIGDTATVDSVKAMLPATPPSTAAVTTYAYDLNGRLTDIVNPEGDPTHFVMNAMGEVVDQVIAYGYHDNTTHRVYDKDGRVSSETSGVGGGEAFTTSYSYDAFDNVLVTTDGRGSTTSRQYDGAGRVTQVSVQLDDTSYAVTVNQYDALGNLVKVTDPRGNAGYFYYDELNRVRLQLDPEGYVTTTTYTAFGEVSSVTRYMTTVTITGSTSTPPATPGGVAATTAFGRDKLGRVTSVTDALNKTESYGLNAFGERVSLTDRMTYVTTYAYDKRGLMLSQTLPIISTRSDNTVQATSVTTKYEYDSRGNRTKTIEAFGLTEQRTTTYGYDKADRVISKTGDAVQALKWDVSSGLIADVDSGSTTKVPIETYSYDRQGNLVLSVDANGAKSFSYYDRLGRKVAEVDAAGTLRAWTYDANGNITSVRVYGDAVAIPSAAATNPPSPVNASNYRETTYAYDRANRLKSTTVTGLFLGRADYTSGYLTSTGNSVTSITYDGAGNAVSQTDAMGNVTYSFYDKLGRKKAQVDGEKFLTCWTYDAEGNVTTEERFAKAVSLTVSTSSDPTALRDNVVGQTYGGASDRVTTFTYDKDGRRLTETRSNVKAASIQSNSLVEATTSSQIAYEYNDRGQVKKKTEATGEFTEYHYDAAGRLMDTLSPSFVVSSGSTVRRRIEYLYDGLGNVTRIEDKTEGGDSARVTTYAYGAGGRLASSTDAASFTRSFGYDAAGRTLLESYSRLKQIDAGNSTYLAEGVAYKYDAAGRLTWQATRSSNGSGGWIYGDSTQVQYNAYGDVSARGVNGLWQETYEYDNGGRMWRSTAGDGSARLYGYNAAGWMTLQIASAGYDLATFTSLSQAITTLKGSAPAIDQLFRNDMAVTTYFYDGRGQNTNVRDAYRALASGSNTAAIDHNRVFNAFGELAQETNGRGYATDYEYNTLGRVTKKKSPQVSVTSEANVTTANARPEEIYSYDVSGRLIGVKDANGNQSWQRLLAGSGYGDDAAVVLTEHHADGKEVINAVNVQGDIVRRTDERNHVTNYEYDGMSRLTAVNHTAASNTATALVDSYLYDGLGQRIAHWNNQLGSGAKEITEYDRQGRVVRTTDFAAHATSYAYVWSATLATTGLGTFGGWTKTTTTASGLTSTEGLDYFGRTVAHTDLGGHVFTYTFNKAGWLTNRHMTTVSNGENIDYIYVNSGVLFNMRRTAFGRYRTAYSTSPTGGYLDTTLDYQVEYSFDKDFNRVKEVEWEQVTGLSGWVTYKTGVATYDALNRVTGYTETDENGAQRVAMSYAYDLNGNVRKISSTYDDIISTPNLTQTFWYKYDTMNRLLITRGDFQGGAIVIGSTGTALTYWDNGLRATATNAANGTETYVYNDDDTLSQMTMNGVVRVSYSRDAMGRALEYHENNSSGATVYERVGITYDAASNVTEEYVNYRDYQGAWWTTHVEYNYTNLLNTHGQRVLGSGTGNEYLGGLATKVHTSLTKNGNAQYETDVYNTYDVKWDSLLTHATELNKSNVVVAPSNDSVDAASYYEYDTGGRLTEVKVQDDFPRNVRLVNNAFGQVITRTEFSSAASNPLERFFYLNDRQIGDIGNNGPSETDYTTAINKRWQAPNNSNPWANGSSAQSFADFDANYTPIGAANPGSAQTYVAHDGETLQSIAAQVWGDASLWWLIAQANGLTGTEPLVSGQTLTIPAKVTNLHHSTGTFEVYDPAKAVGNVQPHEPSPAAPAAKHKKGCGVIGKIIVAVVAIAVVAILHVPIQQFFGQALGLTGAQAAQTAAAAAVLNGTGTIGALSAASATVGAITTAATIAAGAVAGAIGSAASQGVGIALGVQDRFSWKGVGLATVSGGVNAGFAEAGLPFDKLTGGNPTLADALRGAAANSASQGIALAVGLQKRFSWTAVAVEAAQSAASGWISRNGPGHGEIERNEFGDVTKYKPPTAGNFVLSRGASLFAGAGTRSLIEGTDFGDNILADLPSVIGSTIGQLVGQRILVDQAARQQQDEEVQLLEPSTIITADQIMLNASSPLDGVVLSTQLPDVTLDVLAGEADLDATSRYLPAASGTQVTASGRSAELDLSGVTDATTKEFIQYHVEHHSTDAAGNRVLSTPTPELVSALVGYGQTSEGAAFFRFMIEHNLTQPFELDENPTDPGWETNRKTGLIIYNLLPVAVPDSETVPGTESSSSTPVTVLAHEIGHTPNGRAFMNLPEIVQPVRPNRGPNNEIIIYMRPTEAGRREETRSVFYFENPVRRELGLPERRSYYEENDVLKIWGSSR